MCGARRKFPKEVSSERKFSFLTDFLSVSRRLTRKSAARKMKSHFSVGGGFAEVPKKPPNRRLLITVASAKKKTTSGAGEREKLKIQEAPPLL